MKLLTFNIYEGGLGRIDPIAEAIRQSQADVAVLPETWETPLLFKLAGRLGMEFFQAEAKSNPHGHVGVLVKPPYQIREAVNHGPLDDRLTRTAFHALIDSPAGHPLGLIGLHLHARETLADEAIRLRELPAILEIAAPFKGQPHVLAGDFNASHPAQVIDMNQARPKTRERVAVQNGLIPREVISKILAAGYVDAHAIGRTAAKFQQSFTTTHPSLRVDYIFASPELAPAVRDCRVLTMPIARFASDHFPVLAELALGD